MKTEISPERIVEETAQSEETQPTETPRKQSLNLKVRARVGVETRTQLVAGSGCAGTMTQTS